MTSRYGLARPSIATFRMAFGRNGSDLSGLEIGQPTLGLSEPQALRSGVHFPIYAGDEVLGEARPLLAREFHSLRFEFAS